MNPGVLVRPKLKAQALAILSPLGKKFADGGYGGNTRMVMALFEEDMRAPFKDGVVRRVPERQILDGPETKLMRLNFVWNMTMLAPTLGTTKKESGRTALPRILFDWLYD